MKESVLNVQVFDEDSRFGQSDGGITYHQYVTELTYILFLKMAKETGAERQIPEAYRWDKLTAKSGIELKKVLQGAFDPLGR